MQWATYWVLHKQESLCKMSLETRYSHISSQLCEPSSSSIEWLWIVFLHWRHGLKTLLETIARQLWLDTPYIGKLQVLEVRQQHPNLDQPRTMTVWQDRRRASAESIVSPRSARRLIYVLGEFGISCCCLADLLWVVYWAALNVPF